ncbi:MAG: hypothetical protein AB1898_13935 [Acidobacteriota bacterium]
MKPLKQLLKQTWIQLLVGFDVKDPLKSSGRTYTLPENFAELEPDLKRRAGICNLFVNQNQSFEEIARYYQLSRDEVVGVLVEEGFLIDQRKPPSEPLKGGRRKDDR